MSAPKWTPGPWKIETFTTSVGAGVNGEGVRVVDGEGNAVSGTIHHMHYVTRFGDPTKKYGFFPQYSEGEVPPYSPEAHLIAAAPELYEALQTCLADLKAWSASYNGTEYPEKRIAIAMGDAALAKARGEAA